MARRSGNFVDRIIEGVVVLCAVLFFMGGPVVFAVIGGVATALRLVRIWREISPRSAR